MKTQAQTIIPYLWFDGQAEEAAEFYTSVFENSKIGEITRYMQAGQEIHDQEPGSVMTVEFEIEGYKLVGLNGGPQFTFNPSISFMVNCLTAAEVDNLWEKISVGGTALMTLDSYPFSQRYGWIQDQYGVSWQLILPENPSPRKIVPSLMFVGKNCGKAEEAAQHYSSIFAESGRPNIQYYPVNSDPQKEGTVMYGDFTLRDQMFAIMDSALDHGFTFNEAISLLVQCDSQEEVDHLWENLTAVPEAEQCGWLKDKFGVSWQIVPKQLYTMLRDGDQEQSNRVTEAMLRMKKIDINKLKDVERGTFS